MKPLVHIPSGPLLMIWLTLVGHALGIMSTNVKPETTRSDKLYEEAAELMKKGDYPGALAKYEAGLKAAEKLRNKKSAANIWLGIGTIQLLQADYPKALQSFRTAGKIAEEINDRKLAAVTFARMGNAQERVGRYREAQENYEKALRISEDEKDVRSKLLALNGLGGLHYSQGNDQQALEYYQSGLKLLEELKDKRAIATTVNNIGLVYLSQGPYDEAIRWFERALKSYEELAAKGGMASALSNLGIACRKLGSYGKAIEYFQKALKMRQELGEKNGVAEAFIGLGAVYQSQGSYDQSVEYFQQALKIKEDLGDRHGIALTLYNIGRAYMKQALYDKAIRQYQSALKMHEALGHKRGMAEALTGLASVYALQESYAPAIEYYQRALRLSQEINAKPLIGSQLTSLGFLYLKRQEYHAAMDNAQQALTMGEEIKEPETIWRAGYLLGLAQEKLGDPALALKYYQVSIAEIEKVRAGTSSDTGKAGFFQDNTEVYKKACALLLALHEQSPAKGYDKQALAYAEKARARALVDLLAEEPAHLNTKLSPSLQEKEKNLLNRLSQANRTLQRQRPGSEREALVAEIKQLESEHDQLKEAIRREDPIYANLAYPQPYMLDQIRAQVLDEETALVEYLLDDDRSLVYLVSQKELIIQRLPGRSQIDEKVRIFLDAVKSARTGPSTAAALQIASQNLYQDLLSPIGVALGRYRNLIITADGTLHYLPFEALGSAGKTGFRYLIEDHVISYAPSATALGELRQRPRAPSRTEALLALGDPDFGAREQGARPLMAAAAVTRGLYDTRFDLDRLPFAGEELQEIARYFRRKVVRVRRAASEEFVKQAALDNYRVLHFATHGLLDEGNPQASCLVLAQTDQGSEDGFLQVREIYDLKLNADLVVLSACNTGRGRLVRGEGVLGLHRAFFYAGARSVLGSLWGVNDRACADFMNQFYYHLQKGQGKAQALRQVKLAFLKSTTHAHPYYWAAFTLQGEPNEALFLGRSWVVWVLAGMGVLFLLIVARRFFHKHLATPKG